MAEVLQLLLSLLAVATLVFFVWRLKLGDSPSLQSEADVRHAAAEAVDGFEAAHVAVSTCSTAAILADADGRLLLLRQHGSHLAGRLLDGQTSVEAEKEKLVITTPDSRFGSTVLLLPDAADWKRRIDALKQAANA